MKQIKYFLFLIFCYSYSGYAQEILINEFLASNVIIYPEMYDFDDYTDWIELYNPGVTSYSLGSFF